jgi:hypothetical protein
MKLASGWLSQSVRGSALLLVLLSSACTDTVTEVVSAANITIGAAPTDLEPGQVVQLTAQVVSADGRPLSGRTIAWATSAEAVASVDANGLVTARTPGSVTITASSEGRSVQRGFTVRSALPTITSISPRTALPDQAFELTVMGTGFYNGSTIRWNGADRPTTFVSVTELRAAISSADVAAVGPVAITVLNASPGGGTSNAAPLTVRPANPCEYLPPLAIGSSLDGSIDAAEDCGLPEGGFADLYKVVVATAQWVTFRMASEQLDPLLLLSSAAGDRRLAVNDDGFNSLDSNLTILAPAGEYRLYATSFEPAEAGAYTVSFAAGPSTVTNCADVWVMPGVQTSQNMTTSDCRTPSGSENYYSEQYKIYLTAGQTVTVRMTSTEFDAYLFLLDAETGEALAEDDDSAGGTNAELTFTAPSDGTYVIEASSFATEETGAYTLSIP